MKLTTMKTMNVLTIIDGIVGSLSRGGPGREVVLSFSTRKLPTWITKYGSLLGLEKTTTNRWKMTGESVFEALYLTRGVMEVLNDSIPKIGRLPVEDQLGFFVQAREWPRKKFVKFAKYATAWPMARYLQQELPERPEGFPNHPLVFGGKIRRILKNRLISQTDQNSRLWGGYLQGVKRGAAPVSEDFVHDAMLKHRQTLSTPPRGDDEVDTEFGFLIKRALRKFQFSRPKLYEASTSASYGSKRSEGGARGEIRGKISSFSEDHLLRMVETRPGNVVEVRGAYAPTFHEVLQSAVSMKKPYDVMVSAVLEPLKTRLITKGESDPYWLSKTAQKDMWKYLQRYDQFALTGRPMSQSDLYGVLEREQVLEKDYHLDLKFDQWVSGDYSSATDGVDIRMTMAIFNAMLEKSDYSDNLKDVLRGVIGPQMLHYPSTQNKNGDLDPIMQANGQLMGSPLSFPILCLINLVAYWGALEEYLGYMVELRHLPVLINGDDILFRANPKFYEIWKQWVHKVGFTLSLGKNYIHPKILTINSQLYRFVPGRKEFRYLGYLNTGLLTGQSKITGRENARLAPIWAYYNEVIPNAVQPERAHRRFIHYHHKLLDEFTNRGEYNLFLPFHRGGLGFKPVIKPRLTSFQRRFATFLENSYESRVNENVVPKGETLGLVRSNPPNCPISLYHNPRLLLEPLIGPLNKGIVTFETRELTLPILAAPMEDDRPEYKIRQPKRLKVQFRKVVCQRMADKKISSWPWRLAEMIGLTT